MHHELEDEYIEYISNNNFMIIYAGAFLSIVMQFFNICRTLLSSEWHETLDYNFYLPFYVALFLVALGPIIIRNHWPQNPVYLYYIHLSFGIFYILWNLLFNSVTLNMQTSSSIIVFTSALIFTTILLHFRPLHTIMIQLLSYLLFLGLNYHILSMGNIINLTIAVVTTMFSTLIIYAQILSLIDMQLQLLSKNQELRNNEELLRLSIEKQQDIINETIIYRHDMRHSLRLMEQLVQQEKYDKLHSYLAQTQGKLESITPNYYCENETVNLMLSSFEKDAREQGVELITDMVLPPLLPISDTEICSLVYNLLENAIAAASLVENKELRYVKIQAAYNQNKLLIFTENGFAGIIRKRGELPVSIHKRKGHGYGIKSVVAIVEQHNGLYTFETHGQVFYAKVLLEMKNQ